MTTAQKEIREIRRELAETGADPFEVAAEAVASARRYRRELDELKAVMFLRPPDADFCLPRPADCSSRQSTGSFRSLAGQGGPWRNWQTQRT